MDQFLIRNYNRFLVGTRESFRWVDFYIHRFTEDFDKLVKFNSKEDAQTFLNQHTELEKDFDAWILPTNRSIWN